MAKQTSLFDRNPSGLTPAAIARTEANAGIEKSAETAGEEWCDYALTFVEAYLRRHRTMHVDQLWESGLEKPASVRGLGMVIVRAVKNGWITAIKTADGYHASLPSVHSRGGLKQVWESRLTRDQEGEIKPCLVAYAEKSTARKQKPTASPTSYGATAERTATA